jgi:hypothetical protein
MDSGWNPALRRPFVPPPLISAAPNQQRDRFLPRALAPEHHAKVYGGSKSASSAEFIFLVLGYRKAASCCILRTDHRKAIRTQPFVFEPPSGRERHLSVWVVFCFCISCRLVFDMTPITEFDPVGNGFSMESANLGVDL